jgi:hypothetical protein
MTAFIDRRLSVAPMMERTDRHCRYLLRLLSKRVLLYTEMVSIGALQRGDPARALTHDPAEHRLALQLGEASPKGSGAARAWPRSGVSMRSTSTSDARANASKNTGSVFPDPQGRDRPLNVIVWSSLVERWPDPQPIASPIRLQLPLSEQLPLPRSPETPKPPRNMAPRADEGLKSPPFSAEDSHVRHPIGLSRYSPFRGKRAFKTPILGVDIGTS